MKISILFIFLLNLLMLNSCAEKKNIEVTKRHDNIEIKKVVTSIKEKTYKENKIDFNISEIDNTLYNQINTNTLVEDKIPEIKNSAVLKEENIEVIDAFTMIKGETITSVPKLTKIENIQKKELTIKKYKKTKKSKLTDLISSNFI